VNSRTLASPASARSSVGAERSATGPSASSKLRPTMSLPRSGRSVARAPVGVGVDPVAVDMGDMGGRHLGRQADARLHLGQFALGLLELRDGGLELPVGARKLSACSRSWSLTVPRTARAAAPPAASPRDVGIDRHPAALGQRRALDRDRAAVRAAPLHVVGHEGARGLDPVAHEGRGIGHFAVFAGSTR
jgi:hypothetical protein